MAVTLLFSTINDLCTGRCGIASSVSGGWASGGTLPPQHGGSAVEHVPFMCGPGLDPSSSKDKTKLVLGNCTELELVVTFSSPLLGGKTDHRRVQGHTCWEEKLTPGSSVCAQGCRLGGSTDKGLHSRGQPPAPTPSLCQLGLGSQAGLATSSLLLGCPCPPPPTARNPACQESSAPASPKSPLTLGHTQVPTV